MKRITGIVLALLLISNQCFAISDWYQGSGTAPIQGTDNVSDIDANSKNYAFDPLDKLLTHHIWGCTLTHTSDDVITVSVGEVTCSNGAGTIRRMRKNTATTTVDFTAAGVGGIDSGSARDDSSWFDIYAVADADATTFTAIAAKQGTALSDVTYYRYIGSVYNDASDNISNFYWFGNGDTPLIMWDVPVSTATVVSAGAWSAATACRMPSTSTCGVFGLQARDSADIYAVQIRRNGSTWKDGSGTTVVYEDGVGGEDNAATGGAGGQRICMTDSSQQIQYYNDAGDSTVAIHLEGFYIKR